VNHPCDEYPYRGQGWSHFKSMPNGNTLSIFNTHPVNLKRWNIQSARLFNAHHKGQSLYIKIIGKKNVAVPVLVLWVAWEKSKELNLNVKNIFAK
jgi:hypothetical protein